ncbi:MAG: hypothetical protein ACR2OZ_10810 [Verrucomicrobiales bacterium]
MHRIPVWVCLFLPVAAPAASGEPAGQPIEHFDSDPGWESYRSHLVPNPIPVVRQDFGHRAGHRARGAKAGEIGGWIQRSITPAYYAKSISERTLDHEMKASGKFAVAKNKGGSGSLFGWFNSQSRGWRAPNSLAMRIDGNGDNYWLLVEYGTRHWLTACQGTFEGQYQTTKTKPFAADGTSHQWTLHYDPHANSDRGLITFVLDDQKFSLPLEAGHKEDGAVFNRFGLFNQQITGDGMEVYFDDLVIDGQAQDFDRDPGWDARSNNVTREERAIRPMHDFGYSATQHCGGQKGEIGGIVWRDEKPAFYGDRVGPFSLEDVLFASGKIAFTGAGSDSGVYLGWFDSASKKNKKVPEHQEPQKNMLAIKLEGPSRIGHYFVPGYATNSGKGEIKSEGPIIRPDGQVHCWSLRYSPDDAHGKGRIILEFDDVVQTLDLPAGARQAGATFDRFGLFNMQSGGHYVSVYLDDVSYSKRRKQ